MNLILSLDPLEESRISEAARQVGLAPAEYAKKLVHDHLPPLAGDGDHSANDATLALIAQWDREGAQMTPEEVELGKLAWEELKTNINTERSRAGARLVF